jgi:hypothetical protein
MRLERIRLFLGLSSRNEVTRSGSSAQSAAVVAAGALLLAWPALYNRYPLLYPDSMTYLGDGRLVARALFLHQLSDYYGMRSFFYSLGILPWHWNVTPWPIVAFQSLLTAYVVWLVVQSSMVGAILPTQTRARYLILIALLSLLTSVSWYSSLVMPDILGPLLYLCIYLIVFARDTLTRADHVAVALIAWWGITAHATHFLLAAGLCALLTLLLVLRRPLLQGRWKAVGEVAMVIALAAAAQFALHGYLYGEPSLNGERPPFLMARIIADGPGRWYLEQHCGEVKFAICDHVHDLSGDTDRFLWGADGVWANADDDYASRLRQEEIPFVLATVRAFPRQQLSISASAFWKQLTSFALYDLDPSDWVLEEFDGALPGGKPSYLRSRQAQNDMPLEFFTSVHYAMVLVSLLTIGACTPWLLRRGSSRMVGLGVVVVSVVIANALVTGALSNVEERYQSRVVWLVSLLAGLCVLDWLNERKSRRLAASDVIVSPELGNHE